MAEDKTKDFGDYAESYEKVDPARRVVAQKYIVELRFMEEQLGRLKEDIEKNGETEMFSQSEKTEPYERERPAARLFTATDKNYQAIIKQLNELTPPSTAKSKLEAMMKE